ncbi:MAG: hypothetical protein STSR0009_26100 [Methanoregula sp.]
MIHTMPAVHNEYTVYTESILTSLSGHGLFLSREICAITGITITGNCVPGKGTRFEIAVPKGMWRMKGGYA